MCFSFKYFKMLFSHNTCVKIIDFSFIIFRHKHELQGESSKSPWHEDTKIGSSKLTLLYVPIKHSSLDSVRNALRFVQLMHEHVQKVSMLNIVELSPGLH